MILLSQVVNLAIVAKITVTIAIIIPVTNIIVVNILANIYVDIVTTNIIINIRSQKKKKHVNTGVIVNCYIPT